MGVYNTADVVRLVPCPRCGDTGLIAVQFAYGDTQQYSYKIGDSIRWGGNDIGKFTQNPVRILGIPEYCRRYGLEVEDEYVLIVDGGKLMCYEQATARDIAELL